MAGIKPVGAATHINDGLRQLAADTSDLPVGAVVLLSDGAENSDSGVGGMDRETMNVLRNRRWPVHTVGFGKERSQKDVEVDDVSVAARAVADSRMVATVRFHQRGYAGSKATLVVRDGEKALVSRDVTLAADGTMQTETIFFHAGDAGAKSFRFEVMPLAGEENALNNSLSRPVSVSDERRKILYVEGEPRWEYKFIRRAEDDDKTVQVVSMLRTTENKIYRQGISDPKELENGFPVQGGGFVSVLGDHYRVGGGGVLYGFAAGVDTGVCGPAWRWGAVSGGAVLAVGWRVGGVEYYRVAADYFAGGKRDVSSRSGYGGVDGGWGG